MSVLDVQVRDAIATVVLQCGRVNAIPMSAPSS